MSLTTLNIFSIFYIYFPSLLLWSTLYKALGMTMSFCVRKCSEHHTRAVAVWCGEVMSRERFCNTCKVCFAWGWAARSGNSSQPGHKGKCRRNLCSTEVSSAGGVSRVLQEAHGVDALPRKVPYGKPDYLESTQHRAPAAPALRAGMVLPTREQMSP